MIGGPGLCGVCAHARQVVGRSGSSFWLCGLSRTDTRYVRYPRLPMYRCPGFSAADTEGSATGRVNDNGPQGPEPEDT